MDREKVLSYIEKKLEVIDQCGIKERGAVPLEKVLMHLVDLCAKGNFKGIVSIKINDHKVFAPRHDQVETVLEREYMSFE